ncbi:hypothetical protein P43SY_010162 [Pythium insidiosum]|uniref:Uncharacterized protein n=1 Tax=Pythium insidiosum TaxID=114742 RepID=A0AAD5LNJ2_PYTIN|nr:hypothetical protein P43SY_010162 [Pythium insidiosum]
MAMLLPLALALCAACMASAAQAFDVALNGVVSALKMQHSNPVVSVAVDGEAVDLLLTTDIDGILVCSDLPPATAVSPRIGFDYARKLLRLQLNGMLQEVSPADVAVPALNRTLRWPVGRFRLQQQWLSPVALQFFLWKANAQGFLGVGYAHRPRASLLWAALQNDSSQYRYDARRVSRGNGSEDASDDAERSAALSVIHVKSEVSEAAAQPWDWSEPCASVDQADDQGSNSQGITFPLHRLGFACRQSPKTTIHRVDMLGEFSGFWDALVDLNTACLSLPQQFYDSLAGWLGFTYNEELKITEFPASASLPSLQFSLTLDGPTHVVPLDRLVLRNVSTASSAAMAWVCIQRGATVVQNAASVLSPVDPDASSAQRYRLHGSMSLPLYNMAHVPIVLGHMMLQAMGGIVVDGGAKQVAFSHPVESGSGGKATESEEEEQRRAALQTTATCLPVKQCLGQQVHVPRLNACLDPDCSKYYFQSLDPTTKQCAIDAAWLQFLGSILAAFVTLELGFSLGTRRMIRRAVDAAAPDADGGD